MIGSPRHSRSPTPVQLLAAVVLAALFGAARLLSQNPAEQQQPPVFRRAVNLVLVDAYPTRSGRPVADLTQGDFEILEDGVPQTVASFEQVTFRAPVPEFQRVEPRDLGESMRMAADPRNRVFVLYVDTYHLPGPFSGVDPGPAREALRRLLRSSIGEDDVVAFLTPEMSVRSISFVRKTAAIDEFLRTRWVREIRVDDYDETERNYQRCYAREGEEWIAEEMIARKRERQVISTLDALVGFLRELRRDRKALILVSGGWRLFGPSSRLAAPLEGRALPQQGRMGASPAGRLGTTYRDDKTGVAFQSCEDDRMALSHINDAHEFRLVAGAANGANVSIYPVNPQGLVARSTVGEMRRDEAQWSMLYDLAASTDGIAVVDTNGFDGGVQRIVDDMSSYYLLGYYSTNTKLDGRFRKITVRVKKPGVAVRARNGYLAPTAEDAVAPAGAPDAAGAKNPRSSPRREDAAAALAVLDGMRPDRGLFLRAGWAWRGSGPARDAQVSLVVEVDRSIVRSPEWSGGGTLRLTLHDADGRQVGSAATASLSATARVARVEMTDAPLRAGTYTARATASNVVGRNAADEIRLAVPGGDGVMGQPLVFRRGPYTGPAYEPTADLRFRRAERLRVEIPAGVPLASVTAVLLDRNGRPLGVPVSLGERDDDGVRHVTADLVLAPLAPGDYLVEVTAQAGAAPEKVLVAFRVVP